MFSRGSISISGDADYRGETINSREPIRKRGWASSGDPWALFGPDSGAVLPRRTTDPLFTKQSLKYVCHNVLGRIRAEKGAAVEGPTEANGRDSNDGMTQLVTGPSDKGQAAPAPVPGIFGPWEPASFSKICFY